MVDWHRTEQELERNADADLLMLTHFRAATDALGVSLLNLYLPAEPPPSAPQRAHNGWATAATVTHVGARAFRAGRALIPVVARGYDVEAFGLARVIVESSLIVRRVAHDDTGGYAKDWISGKRDSKTRGGVRKLATKDGIYDYYQMLGNAVHVTGPSQLHLSARPGGEAINIEVGPLRAIERTNALLAYVAFSQMEIASKVIKGFRQPEERQSELADLAAKIARAQQHSADQEATEEVRAAFEDAAREEEAG